MIEKLYKGIISLWMHYFSYEPVKTISSERMQRMVYTTNSWVQDSEYQVASLEHMVWLLRHLPLKRIKWQKEVYDCDNFSGDARSIVKKMGPLLPFGEVEIRHPQHQPHALNFFFADETEDWYFYEPQTGEVIPKEQYPAGWIIHRVIV